MKKAASIPLGLYKKIYSAVPLPCVDLVVEDVRGNFLLVWRKNSPDKNKWWFPGGRLVRGERLAAAALRKLREETGLTGRVAGLMGVHEYFARPGAFPGTTAHNIALVFRVRVRGVRPAARLDRQSTEYRWWEKPARNFHPYVKRYLVAAKQAPRVVHTTS
ncbi:MAG: NUDIX domain-containing protein [Candidatus Liptonbacteria bacterium]|nr:NUDIX domain-containing protein [Candidatus Liptonbacteria bacterium]